jgi:hydrogenase maturation factor
MAGEVERARLADKKRIRPGDDIILSRGIAIEGTATIASEQSERLAPLDPDLVRRARRLLSDPGISVVREALLAVETAEVHGMHDPTEGGLFTGVREIIEAAGVGVEIAEDQIQVLPETTAICALLGLDPMGLLASGSLLVVCDQGSAKNILRAYHENEIPARIIGRVKERQCGIMLRGGRGLIPLPEYERDEITKLI